MSRDLGDFQTPAGLVDQVVALLDVLQIPCTRVLEPTCGKGNFLAGLLALPQPPCEMVGFELQAEHLKIAQEALDPAIARLQLADFFQVDLKSLGWRERGQLLVVGNPPWVTAAELGRLGSDRGPARRTILGMNGLDSLTGSSNFDLAEAVWHKLLNELEEPDATIALLCKYVTARKVLRWIVATGKRVSNASIYRIDARKWFSASVDACLLVVSLGSPEECLRVPVYTDLTQSRIDREIGIVDGMIVADMATFAQTAFAFGHSPRVWRQGVKHDAASIMELREHDGGFWNGLGEEVCVEPDCLFPLMKGSDFANPHVRRRVIVTQRKLGEDTASLQTRTPRLWNYLCRHASIFEARKSRIHRGQPAFSMFGIGDYTFQPHKVAIPGVHKGVPFRALQPFEGQPVVLDDTCYFLPCPSAADAQTTASLLNGPIATKLIASLRFDDAKRPITKSILQRVDLSRLNSNPPPLALATGSPVE